MPSHDENPTPKKGSVVSVPTTPPPPSPGIGLDCGTMNIISARKVGDKITYKGIRDAFIDVDSSQRSMLRVAQSQYVERDGQIYLLGDGALKVANIFGKEVRRPLKSGMVSPGDQASLSILGDLIHAVAGEAQVKGEPCCFSVPAAPINQPNRDLVYHKGILSKIIGSLGYTPIPVNEAMAVVYSSAADDDFSALGVSWGSGMVNFAMSVSAIEGMSFSTVNSGDWVDEGAARARGQTQSRMCAIKESGVDILNPEGDDAEAIAFYYRELIDSTLQQSIAHFRGSKIMPDRPIPMYVAGGTSMAKGFLELLGQRVALHRRQMPIQISGIHHVKDPLNAVSLGLLVQASQIAQDGG